MEVENQIFDTLRSALIDSVTIKNVPTWYGRVETVKCFACEPLAQIKQNKTVLANLKAQSDYGRSLDKGNYFTHATHPNYEKREFEYEYAKLITGENSYFTQVFDPALPMYEKMIGVLLSCDKKGVPLKMKHNGLNKYKRILNLIQQIIQK